MDQKLDELYDRIDDALLAGDFDSVDREIAAADVARTDLTMLLGLLTISHAAREHLPSRERFAVKVFLRAEREQGTNAAVELLRGLVDERPVSLVPMPLLPPEEPMNERAFKWTLAARHG